MDGPEPEHDLVSIASDELRNAIASILDCAELIDSGDLLDERLHLYSAILLREGRRLSAVVNDALELNRLEHGTRVLDLAPVDIRSLIQRAVFAAGEDERRAIESHVPDDLPLVSGEAEAILEVLANFLSNARRFSPDGGAIDVSARLDGDMVEIEIVDHGIGIEAESLPKLFRKFYRGDSGVGRMTPGAGLGLTINQKIIEAHGGQVAAGSKGLGQGARFHFTLPTARLGSNRVDVLIVEDSQGFASLMKAQFTALGLSTVRAADAETAQHLMAHMAPRAVILDLGLPVLQGEHLLSQISRAGSARIPVVVLTARNLTPDEISALEAGGATAVLPKEAGAPQAAVSLIAEALAPDSVAG